MRVPSALPGTAASPLDSADTRLSGRWLLAARLGWVALTLLVLTLNAVMLPRYNAILQSPCQPNVPCFGLQLTSYDQRLLHQMGLSLGFLAGYQVMLDAVSVVIYCALGALIFWRKSADRMALFCAFMLVLFGGVAFTEILQDAAVSLAPAWFVLVSTLSLLGQSSFLIFFLLFPSGRFVPRWTRWLALFILGYWIYVIYFNTIYYKEGDGVGNAVFFTLLLGVVVAQVYRYRRVSTARERQQTKWVVFGFAIGIIGFVLLIGLGNALLPPAVLQSSVITVFVARTGTYGFLVLIPISIAFAILRSRLYDIDVVINRTLVYGSLTGILGALYAGLIIGLEALGALVMGPSAQQPVALVVSTLIIAALFQPARKRIQWVIDRRFYRQKYDAEKTLAAFSATLRSEVDLNELQAQLIGVVQETMRPAHVSLWLRQPQREHRQ